MTGNIVGHYGIWLRRAGGGSKQVSLNGTCIGTLEQSCLIAGGTPRLVALRAGLNVNIFLLLIWYSAFEQALSMK